MTSLFTALLVVFLSATLLAGPTRITVTVHAVPEGAAVFANDARTYMGVTPLDLKYEVHGDCSAQQGMRVQWPSGAVHEQHRLTLCRHVGTRQTLTFTRPDDAPNPDLDWQLALQRDALAQAQA